MLKKNLFAVLILFGCGGSLLAAALPSFAQVEASYTFSPLQVTFAPIGQRATQSFLVTNTGQKSVAIQIRMVKRMMDLDGKENNTVADDDFIVYPPQMLVKAGERQTVRVTWVGNATSSQELAYRIVAEQLPVDLKEIRQTQGDTTVAIKVLFAYQGSVYITPPNVAPKLVLESAICEPSKSKDSELVLTFANQGTAHALLTNLKLNLTPSENNSKPVTLIPKQLKGVSGENILAGSKRRFSLPCPSGLSNRKLTATFEYDRN